MKLHIRLERIKVQYLDEDGKWKTGNFYGLPARFNGDDARSALLFFMMLTEATGGEEQDRFLRQFARRCTRDTPIRVVRTKVYVDTTGAYEGYEGREFHTHEVLAGPVSYNEKQEMRIYT